MNSQTSCWLVLALLACCSSCQAQLTDSEKQEIVRFNNFLRRNVVPKAGDMNGLFWDDNLATLAQEAADKCIYQHNYGGAYAKLGENIYKGGRRNMSEIFMFMFLERENYDYKTGACKPEKYPMFNTCGHYLQLVTARLTKVGCGIKQCSDGQNILYCEYNTVFTNPPYEAGEPGTKCSHSLAGHTQNGLCYFKQPLAPPPISGPLDCHITCLNYGNKTSDEYTCGCSCPRGFGGKRCGTIIYRSVPNDCKAQLVTCQNDGTPTLNNEVCKCVCPDNYRGDACEVNILEVDNSVYWYFGQSTFYNSYYPVDPDIWNSRRVHATLLYYLTIEMNAVCKANYQLCCPNSPSTTTDSNFVTYNDLKVTAGYPTNALDGSLKVGVNFRLSDTVVATCGDASGPYLNRNAVLAAAEKAMGSVKTFLNYFSVATIKYE